MASLQVYAPLWSKLLSAFGITDYASAKGEHNGLSQAFGLASEKLAKQMTTKQSSYKPITWAQRQTIFDKCFETAAEFNNIKRSDAVADKVTSNIPSDESNIPANTATEPKVPEQAVDEVSYDIDGLSSVANLFRVPYITGDKGAVASDVAYIGSALFYNVAYQLYNPEVSTISDLTILSTRSNVPLICTNMSVQTQLVSAIVEKFSGKPPINADVEYISHDAQTGARVKGRLYKFDIAVPTLADESHPYLSNNPNMIVVRYGNTKGTMINITDIITDPDEIAKINVYPLALTKNNSNDATHNLSYISTYDDSVSDDDYSYYNDPSSVLSELGVVAVVAKPAIYIEPQDRVNKDPDDIDLEYKGVMCLLGCVNLRDWMDWHKFFHLVINSDLDALHGYINETERTDKIKEIIKEQKRSAKSQTR